MREIKPGVLVWIPEDILEQDGDPQFSRSGTAGFIITKAGVVVVNTTNTPMHARELLYEIRRRTEAPVRYVINTDAHGDHTLGNEVFVDQQAAIISTSRAKEDLRRYYEELNGRIENDYRLPGRMRGIHLTLPTQTFDLEMSLRLDEAEIRLLNLGGGHSPGDAVVYLPEAKVLFLGDLYENSYIPRMGSSDVRRWIEILRQVENWDVETYVPGHGDPGDRNDVAEFRQFLEWLETEVWARIQQGKSLAQVKRELLPFENYRWHARDLAPSAVEAVYKQLAAALPTAPLSGTQVAQPTPP